jgi:hypothetical protein
VEVVEMKASELFEQVTADLVATIEAGASNWRMPWQRLATAGTPRSVDGRPYRTGASRVFEVGEWPARRRDGPAWAGTVALGYDAFIRPRVTARTGPTCATATEGQRLSR